MNWDALVGNRSCLVRNCFLCGFTSNCCDFPQKEEEKEKEDEDTVTLTFQTTKVVEPSIKAITIEEQMDTGANKVNWRDF